MKDPNAVAKAAKNRERKAAEYDWQSACLESQTREKQERALRAEAESQEALAKLMDRHYRAELRRQSQAAWMRGDYVTADRIAVLIGDPKPSDHEAAELRGEVRS